MNSPTPSLDTAIVGDIVIVDDTIASLKLLSEILTKGGYLVRPASDGALALRSIHTKLPTLILLDIRMPIMDGFEVCSRLKADERTRDIPIIFLSSLTDMEDRIHGFKLGAADYITKPFQVQDVLMRVKVHANLFLAQTQLKQQNLEFERLNQQLIAEIAARKELENQLKAHQENLEVLVNQRTHELDKANEKYQALFLEARDGIVVVDVHNGMVVDCNPEFERQCGRSLAQLKILQIWTLLPAQQFEAGKTLFQQIVASGSGSGNEFTIQQLDGTLLSVEFIAKVIQFDNKHYLQFMVRDITERKRTQEALIASEKEFRLLAESMPQIVWISSAEGQSIYHNQQWEDYTGLSLEESYGNGWNKTIYPDDQKRTWDVWQNAINTSTPYSLECQLRRADGSYRWWLVRGTPIFDEHKKVCKWFGTCTDIHDIKEAERVQREKERLLADSQAVAHIGSWAMDISTGTIKWSEETFRLYGLSPLTDKPPAIGQFFELLHPDDRLRMKDWLEAISSGKQASELEYRTHTVNGNSRYLLRTGVLETDSNGKPLRIIGTVQDITDRKKAEETIHDLAYYDPLTHLPNRSLMHDRLKQALISRKLKSQYGAVLFIDLNNFKTLNETQGHDIGDLLLLKVSTHLQTAVHEDDTIARIGGDEFVVLLDALDITTELAAVQAETVAKRILAAIGVPLNLRGYEYSCSASIGIALFHSHEISVDNLLKKADMAVHQAKQFGKNTICFFDPAVQTALEFRVQLESWMRKALQDEYRLYYQIQVDDKGKAMGAEALIRWYHPEQGIISPADFIPLAEETGLIIPIGHWVLETACMQLKAWEQNQNTRHLILAVNVSAKQFNQPDFVKQVLTVLEQTGANPDKLKLELTESMLAHNVEDIIAKMKALRAKGVRFSLDDFGTGFSSLSYLKRLPFNQLKIDQSFVRDALTDPNDAAIIRTIIDLGQSLGMDIIAEGVETEQQQNFLAAHGCKHYQGYLFSKPLPLEAFEQLLCNKTRS